METNNNVTKMNEPAISVWTEEDDKITRVEFTEEMKKDYKILLPTMLPRHMKMIASLLKVYGYDAEMLENTGQKVIDTGLMYVHNDTCYPVEKSLEDMRPLARLFKVKPGPSYHHLMSMPYKVLDQLLKIEGSRTAVHEGHVID